MTLTNKNPTRRVTDSRWSKYLLASAAGAAAVTGPQTSVDADVHQVIVNSDIADTSIDGFFQVFGPYGFDEKVDPSFVFLHALSETGPGVGILAVQGYGNLQIAGVSVSGFPYASNLAYQQNVSTLNFTPAGERNDMAWGGGGGYPNSQFLQAGTGYVGFRFDLGKGTQYGFAHIEVTGGPQHQATLFGYAWADAGEEISTFNITGIPEPGSLGCLAIGAMGLVAWRRKRSSSQD